MNVKSVYCAFQPILVINSNNLTVSVFTNLQHSIYFYLFDNKTHNTSLFEPGIYFPCSSQHLFNFVLSYWDWIT